MAANAVLQEQFSADNPLSNVSTSLREKRLKGLGDSANDLRHLSTVKIPSDTSDMLTQDFDLLDRIRSKGEKKVRLIEMILSEVKRRSLHLKAFTAAMHELGFKDYDAEDAFLLAAANTRTLILSEPIIASSHQVLKISGKDTQPQGSSRGDNEYTYNENIFGRSYSFGFTRLKFPIARVRYQYPVIGIDTKVIEEIDQLINLNNNSEVSTELRECFSRVINFNYRACTLSGHDHFHTIGVDFARQEFKAPFETTNAFDRYSKLVESYPGGIPKEERAALGAADAFLMLNELHPSIRNSFKRQCLAYADDVSLLYRSGLSLDSASYLLFVGVLQAQVFTPLSKSALWDNIPFDVEPVKTLLREIPLKRVNIKSLDLQVTEAKEEIDFTLRRTDSLHYYLLKSLDELYKILKTARKSSYR